MLKLTAVAFLKKGHPWPVFIYFRVLKQTLQFFTANIREKMSIQYTVLGFEPMSSHNQ